MEIKNRQLTLVQNVGNGTVDCTAACTVEFNGFELAALANPLHPGFRLRCVLRAVDPGVTTAIFTYPRSIFLQGPAALLNLNCQFGDTLSSDILDEDTNGPDEIRARFTLVDLSTGQSIGRNSPNVNINIV